MAYVDDSIELHQGDVDSVIKDVRVDQTTQYDELKQDIIDIYTLMQTMGGPEANENDIKPPGPKEQIPGQQKIEDLYWWKMVCPETPKLVAQVACYARCQSCMRCLVGYRLRIDPISDPGSLTSRRQRRPKGLCTGRRSKARRTTITNLLLL